MNDKEKIKRIQNMIDFMMENFHKQGGKTYLVQDTIDDLQAMRRILKS